MNLHTIPSAIGVIMFSIWCFLSPQLARAQCTNIPIPAVQGLNPAYSTTYILTDLSGAIVATSTGSSFTIGNPYPEGTYNIYALNYDPTNPPTPAPAVGSAISDYRSNSIAGCYKLSDGIAYNCGCKSVCYSASSTFVYSVTATQAGYSTHYFLTNASGLILSNNTTGDFTAAVAANFPTVTTFHVHYLNYVTTDFPNPPLANGVNISTLGAGCRNADFEEDYICFNLMAIPVITSTPTACSGSTYSITTNATVATGTLEYSLDGGAYQTSNVFSGLVSGSTHSVTVRTVGSTCTAISTGITATCACAAPPSVVITESTLSTCGTDAVTFNYTVANGPATVSSTGAGTLSTTSLANGTGTATYTPSASDAGTSVTITASIADPDGIGLCLASSDNVVVTVNALPAVTVGGGGAIACGATINLTSTPSGASSYSWTGPNGYTSNVQNPVRSTATASMSGIYTVVVTGTNGCSASATTNVTVNACSFVFRISDPCSCRNNATTLTNGQFNEIITVYGPAGFVVRAENITGLYQTSSTALVTVPFATPVTMAHNGLTGMQSAYNLQGVHIDNIGYTVTAGIYEPDGITPVDVDLATPGVQNTFTVSNKCAYPDPDFSVPLAPICNGLTPVSLTPIIRLDSGISNGTGVFSGSGVNVTNFIPANAGLGTHNITLTYTGGIDVATNDRDGDGDIDTNDTGIAPNATDAAYPGCVQAIVKTITVIDCCNADPGIWQY